MTVEDALKAMTAIDGQNDGSDARMALAEALYLKLLEDPENFWEFFWESVNARQPSHARELSERLLRSGAVTEATTFDDIPAILAWDAAAMEQWTNDGSRQTTALGS